MESGLRFAAIDIGSNAIRLLFTRVISIENKPPHFIKESLIRMPLRLGRDAFTTGKISDKNCDSFVSTIIGFKNLIDAYNPISFRACATAAMRNAANGSDLVRKVREATGINLDIISGQEEATMILSKDINQYLKTKKNYIHIDVGGGSTELTIISNGKKINSKSFSIGSVRLLENKVQESYWEVIHDWIKEKLTSLNSIKAIGSGGNINKIASMLGKPKGKSIHHNDIKYVIKKISKKNIEERITAMGLRPDRADVITHASKIYLKCMQWSGAIKIIVPQSGLADGIVSQLYDDYKKTIV